MPKDINLWEGDEFISGSIIFFGEDPFECDKIRDSVMPCSIENSMEGEGHGEKTAVQGAPPDKYDRLFRQWFIDEAIAFFSVNNY